MGAGALDNALMPSRQFQSDPWENCTGTGSLRGGVRSLGSVLARGHV